MNKILLVVIALMIVISLIFSCSFNEPTGSNMTITTGNLTSHTQLTNIGTYTHPVLDAAVDALIIAASSHNSSASNVHQVTGDVVGTSNTQVITNKTMQGFINTGNVTNTSGNYTVLMGSNGNITFLKGTKNGSTETIYDVIRIDGYSDPRINFLLPDGGTGGFFFKFATPARDGFFRYVGTAIPYWDLCIAGSNYPMILYADRMIAGTDGTINIGGAVGYYNDINYKTLTDRGCLGSFDDGVEMQDGSIVSDVEALKLIKVLIGQQTIYGVPRLDYSTMPKAVYKPAKIAEKDIIDIHTGLVKYRAGEKEGADGAETTALISILIGSIKELDAKNQALENRLKLLEAK